MGEPALQLPEEDQPDIRPDLSAQESRPQFGVYDGGAESTEPRRGHLQSVPGGSGDSPAKAEDAERKGLGLADAAKSKAGEVAVSTAASAVGGAAGGQLAKAGAFFWGSRKRKSATVAGGVGVGTFGGIIFGAMLMLAPMKVMSMVENLQDHFSASGEQAAEDMTDKLFQHYLVQKVMPGMVEGKCNSTRVSKSCAKVDGKGGIVSQLFLAWQNGNLEGKMARDYGIEIIRTGDNKFYLKTADLSERISLGTYNGNTAEFEGKAFAALNRTEFRREYKTAVKGATSWKQMYHKYGMNKLAVDKYGARLCVIKCSETADKISDSIDAKKSAAKSMLIERVVTPRNEMYALALQCALSSFSCGGGDEVDENGEHTSQVDRDLRARLASVRSTYGQAALDKLFEDSADIRQKGIAQHMVGKLVGQVAAQTGAKTLGALGMVDLVATIVSAQGNIGPALTKLNYAMYSATAVQTAALFASQADEIRAGKTDLAAVGSFADSLNQSTETDQGGYGAEQVPLYQNLNGTSAASKTVKGNSKSCDEGDSVSEGEIVCDRMILGARGKLEAAQVVTTLATKNPLYIVPGLLADGWVKLRDILLSKVGAVLVAALKLAGLGAAYEWMEQHLAELTAAVMTSFVETVFPSPLGDNPSGGRQYELAGAGFDTLANDYTHHGLGGEVLDEEESAAVRSRQIAEKREEFESKSLYSRVADTGDTSSLISQVALAAPTSLSGMSSFVGSMLSNPMQSLLGSFGSLLTGKSSAVVSGKDPFGIKQYGIPTKKIQEMGDPEAFDEAHCQDSNWNQDWGKAAKYDDETGQYYNDDPNLCLTLEAVAMMAGGKFDTSLLPEDGVPSTSTATGDATSFTVASYNLLNVDAHAANSITVGGCNTNPVPDDPICTKTRTARQAQIITGTGKSTNPAFDLVGTQETSARQYALLKQELPGYDSWPADGSRLNNRDDGATTVFWNKSKFSKIDHGRTPGLSNTTKSISSPWVKLRTSTQQELYFMSLHYANSTFGGTPENIKESSRLTMEWVKSKVTPTTPVIVVGDFNDRLGEKLSYCVYTANSLMQHALDMQQGTQANKQCPGNRFLGIDHIYLTPAAGMTVSNWTHMANTGLAQISSDHTPVYAKVSFKGADDQADTSKRGWVWPATKISPGPCWNAFSSGYYHAGMDMNTRSYGVDAKAAHSGTVYRTGYDDAAGNYITVRVSSGLFYSYEHLESFARGMRQGTKVSVGQSLGTIGATGNVNLSSSVGHLHMVVSVDGSLGGYSTSSQAGSSTRDPLNYLPNKAPSGYACTK